MGQKYNMARNVLHQIGIIAIQGLCCLTMLVGVGCAKHEPAPVVLPSQPDAPAATKPLLVRKVDQETLYEQGLYAFDAGEIKRAVALWREVLAAESEQSVRQKALFALASVKLSQAANDTELSTAMDLLEAWAKGAPPGGSGEDPRFLLPVLRAFKPAFVVKDLKANMERECGKKLVEREDQVRRSLQQQVKALESIHQQIQEKKKGLTNY
jgi:hypothetical protein